MRGDVLPRLPLAILVAALLAAACGSSASPSPSAGAGQSASASTGPSSPASVAPGSTVGPSADATASAAPSNAVKTYVVRKNDTLYGIAKKFGITLKALQAANPQVTDPTKLQVGQKLTIPGP